MIYTPEERRTILYVLSEVMLADEIVHPKEKEFFDEVYETIGANLSDLSTMEHIDSDYAMTVYNQMDEEKKVSFLRLLYDMALADGYLDPREQKVLDFYQS